MMRGPAGLHADEAGQKLGEEGQNGLPPELLLQHHVPVSVDGVNLENTLGAVDADGNGYEIGGAKVRLRFS